MSIRWIALQPGLPGTGDEIVSPVLTFTHPDPSVDNGKSIYFYILEQQTDGQWRLVSGGTGL